MTNIIEIEKSKLNKVIKLARLSEDIEIDDLLELAGVTTKAKTDKEITQEQTHINLNPYKDYKKEKPKKLTKKHWSRSEEEQFIKMVESGVDYGYIMEKLGRSRNSLYNKASLLRKVGRLNDSASDHENSGQPYTGEENALLQDTLDRFGEVAEVPELWLERISNTTGRSVQALKTRLYYFKNEER